MIPTRSGSAAGPRGTDGGRGRGPGLFGVALGLLCVGVAGPPGSAAEGDLAELERGLAGAAARIVKTMSARNPA